MHETRKEIAPNKPLERIQARETAASRSERERETLAVPIASKLQLPLWLQIVASISIPLIMAFLALAAMINPQFAELRSLIRENREAIVALEIKFTSEIAALDSKFTSEIARLDNRITEEVTRLDNRITEEVTSLDNKFDALANLMIVALTNGEPTEAELVAVWESIRDGQ